MTTIAERAARGAALLDEHKPGWWERIDLDTLALESPCRCILGQLWSAEHPDDPYEIALDELDLHDKDEDFGFDKYSGPGSWSEYALLTDAWHALIEARRAAS